MGKFSLGKLVMTRAVHDKMNGVIDCILSVFSDVDSTMCGLSWGDLYERYHKNSYNPQEVPARFRHCLVTIMLRITKAYMNIFWEVV